MIQSINRALDIIEFLAESGETPRTLGEIASKTGLNAATCRNILKTLALRNYVEQEGRRKGYFPGPMCYTLSKGGMYYRGLFRTAEPFMEHLAAAVSETVLLAVLRQGKRFTLGQVEGGQALQVRRDIIYDGKVYDTATGRLLISFLPGDELKLYLAGSGLKKEEAKELSEITGQVKKDGFCIHMVHEKQVAGIAYPVKERGIVAAALGLFLPAIRFKGGHRRKVLKGLEKTSRKISEKIDENLEKQEGRT